MISVYALVVTTKKKLMTGGWRGDENTAPDFCMVMPTRNGDVETHYWVVRGDKAGPDDGEKCLCGKKKYNMEDL